MLGRRDHAAVSSLSLSVPTFILRIPDTRPHALRNLSEVAPSFGSCTTPGRVRVPPYPTEATQRKERAMAPQTIRRRQIRLRADFNQLSLFTTALVQAFSETTAPQPQPTKEERDHEGTNGIG